MKKKREKFINKLLEYCNLYGYNDVRLSVQVTMRKLEEVIYV